MRYTVVGDIHGQSGQLSRLLGKAEIVEGRTLIFLGDYVDVGSNSKEVLDILIGFSERHPEAVFLKARQ